MIFQEYYHSPGWRLVFYEHTHTFTHHTDTGSAPGHTGIPVFKQLMRPPRIYYVKNTGSMNARTIPPFGIFINISQAGNAQLLQHELVHWRQYQRQGLACFVGGYWLAQLLYGYDRNPYEIEARQNETPCNQLHYTDAVRSGTANTVYNPNFRR
jgi:hypothetical protein